MHKHTTNDIQQLTLEENILLAGVLAKIYAETDYNSPIQNWGWAIANRELPVGDTLYRVGPARCTVDGQETNCVQVTIISPQRVVHWQFPIDQLRSVHLRLQGFVLPN